MKSIYNQLIGYSRRKIWAIIVAFMIGIHNFYKEEIKLRDDIVLTIENNESDEDSAPKN